MSIFAQQVLLRRNPVGRLSVDDFELVEIALPPLASDQVRVRNRWMSIDPYMRLALSSQAGYLAMMQPGDPMGGAAVGIVEESRDWSLPPGSLVLSQMGWRSQFVSPGSDLVQLDGAIPGSWHLGLLGLTGVTAFVGIEQVLLPRAGETIFVSGAAGAVGSIACQLAKRRGARVLGCAGSPDKVRWLIEEASVDAVVDYNAGPVDDFLGREAPDGVDCYFDNVGGPMLETLLEKIKPHGRIALCGAMSQYQSGDYRAGPVNFFSIIERSLAVTGFNAFLLSPDETLTSVGWLRDRALSGELKPCATIVNGLHSAAPAFVGLFDGSFLGKLIVEF